MQTSVRDINVIKDLFNRKQEYSRVDLDKSFPKYVFDNKTKLNDWIV